MTTLRTDHEGSEEFARLAQAPVGLLDQQAQEHAAYHDFTLHTLVHSIKVVGQLGGRRKKKQWFRQQIERIALVIVANVSKTYPPLHIWFALLLIIQTVVQETNT